MSDVFLSALSSGFICVSACVRISFSKLNNIPCMYVVHFVYSFICLWMGCFHLLAIVNNAVMNTGVQISTQVKSTQFFLYVPRSRVAGSCGKSGFKFLRNDHCFPEQLYHVMFSPAMHIY